MPEQPTELAKVLVFATLLSDGSMSIATCIAPGSSSTGKWERIYQRKLGKDHRYDGDEVAATAGRVAYQHLAAIKVHEPVQVHDTPQPAPRRCVHVGCRAWVSCKHGAGTHCYVHRAEAVRADPLPQ